MIMTYPVCHRGRDDCQPVHCIASHPEGLTEEQIFDFDFTPNSYVCCGMNTAENRVKDQDRYRLCFNNQDTDEMTDNDMQDLTSLMAVISAAMNLDAVMKANNGIVEVPFDERRGLRDE